MLGRRRLLALPLFAMLVVAAVEALPGHRQDVLAAHRPASIVASIRPSLVDAVLPSHHLGDRPTTHRSAAAVAPADPSRPTRFAALLPELLAPALPAARLPLVAPRAPPALG
jgi:hypothetical protein